MKCSKELRVAILPVAFEPHGGVSLIKVALIGGALGLALVASLTRCGRISPRCTLHGNNRHIS
jgi:hypothetical protein